MSIFDSLVADFDGKIGDEQSQQTLNCALFRQPQVYLWTTPLRRGQLRGSRGEFL